MEGFEEGSKHCLQFNIWRTEREWKLQKIHEANSTLAPADDANKTELETEAREQGKEAKKDKIPRNDR